MAFTGSTFRRSLAGLLRTVLTRIAASSPMTTICSFVLVSMSTPVAKTQRYSKDNLFWDLRPLNGLAITCWPVFRMALVLLLPYSLKYAVRPSFSHWPLLSSSIASFVIHRASKPIFMALSCSISSLTV